MNHIAALFIVNDMTCVSLNGTRQQVVSFLNPPLGISHETACVRHVGQPTHPYASYH
jgi:hypothetical protein